MVRSTIPRYSSAFVSCTGGLKNDFALVSCSDASNWAETSPVTGAVTNWYPVHAFEALLEGVVGVHHQARPPARELGRAREVRIAELGSRDRLGRPVLLEDEHRVEVRVEGTRLPHDVQRRLAGAQLAHAELGARQEV